MGFLNEFWQVAFEFVYILMYNNRVVHVMEPIAMVIESLQLFSFAYHPTLKWNQPYFQSIMSIFLFQYENDALFALGCIFTLLVNICVLRIDYEIRIRGGVGSPVTLSFTRIGLGLVASFLFYPLIDMFLRPFNEILFGHAEVEGLLIAKCIISGILILCLLFNTFIITSLSFCPDMTNVTTFTSAISLYEIPLLALRFFITMAFSFDSTGSISSIILFITSLFDFTCHLIYPSYYNNSINYIKSAIGGAFLPVTLLGVVICNGNIDSVEIYFYTSLACIPVFGIVGFLLTYFRLKPLIIDERKDLMFCEDGEFNPNFLNRIVFIFDYEIAIRSLTKVKDYETAKKFGKWLFEIALERHPRSSLIHSHFVRYLSCFCKEGIQISPFTRYIAKKTMQMDPMMLIRYSFFYVNRVWEQNNSAVETGEGTLDIMDAVMYRHDLSYAFFHHKSAIKSTIYFWKSLASKRVDIWTLSSILDEIDTHQKKADFFYRRLTKRFPNSTRIIRLYSTFIKDVDQHKALAEELEYYADDLEDQLQKLKQRAVIVSGKSVQMSVTNNSTSGESSLANHSQFISRSGTSSSFGNDRKRSIGGSDTFKSESSNQIDIGQEASIDKSMNQKDIENQTALGESLRSLQRSIMSSVGVMTIIIVILYSISNSSVLNNQSAQLHQFTRMINIPTYASSLMFLARKIEDAQNNLYKLNRVPTSNEVQITSNTIDGLRLRMGEISDTYVQLLNTIKLDSNLRNDKISSFWNNPNITVQEITSLGFPLPKNVSFISFLEEFAYRTGSFSNYSGTYWTQLSERATSNPEFRFIMDNFFFTLIFKSIDLMNLYQISYYEARASDVKSMLIYGGIGVTIPVVIFLLIVRPQYLRITKERIMVWEDIFKTLPDSTNAFMIEMNSNILANWLKDYSSHYIVTSSSSGKDQKASRTRSIKDRRRRHFNNQAKNSQKSENSKREKDNSHLDWDLRWQAGSEMRNISRLFGSVTLVTIYQCAMIIGICGTMITFSNQVKNTATYIYLSSSRMGMSSLLYFDAIEMIRFDNTTWPSRDFIRGYTLKELDIAYSLHYWLKNGWDMDNGYSIPGTVGTRPEQDAILIDRTCSDPTSISCSGLDLLYSNYLNSLNDMIYIPDQLYEMYPSSVQVNSSYAKVASLYENSPFYSLLQKSEQLFETETIPIENLVYMADGIIFIASLVIVFISPFGFYYRLTQISRSIRISQRVLRTIPSKLLQDSRKVKFYIETGNILKGTGSIENVLDLDASEDDIARRQSQNNSNNERTENSNIKATASILDDIELMDNEVGHDTEMDKPEEFHSPFMPSQEVSDAKKSNLDYDSDSQASDSQFIHYPYEYKNKKRSSAVIIEEEEEQEEEIQENIEAKE